MASYNGVPAKYKRKYLRDRINDCLGQFRQDFQTAFGLSDLPAPVVEAEILEWRFNWIRNRSLRTTNMGNPVWYADVQHMGPSEMTKIRADGGWLGGCHEFAASLILEYKAGVSTDLFDEITDSTEKGKQGLLIYLRNLGIKPVHDEGNNLLGNVRIFVRETGDEQIYRDQRSIVNFDKSLPGAGDKGHMLSFRAQVKDVQ